MSDLSQVDLSALEQQLNEVQEVSVDQPVPCARLIGCAGTGKTFTLQHHTDEHYDYLQKLEADPDPASQAKAKDLRASALAIQGPLCLTATTGIAAVNLGGITINSTLRYGDLESLRDVFLSNRLERNLHPLALKYRWLVIEEYSMADAPALDIWHDGVQQANRYADVGRPMGILLVGDLAQLPPVSKQWVFGARTWGNFADHTIRLTKVYRQDQGPFLDALNLAREGQGGPSSEVLDAAGIQWCNARMLEFPGTTILPKNDMVNSHNRLMLDTVRTKSFLLENRRWGQQRREWDLNPKSHEWGIPPTLEIKIGALVMILSNAQDFRYVNGDTGIVEEFDEYGQVHVRIKRTGKVETITRIVRGCDFPEKPNGWTGIDISKEEDEGDYIPRQHYRGRVQRFVNGQINYYPLRLAYATTVHKSQGLTLDACQIDFRDWFFGQPAMLYVALSRCRTLSGLRLVGMREKFIKQCKMATEVLPWL